jgi:hypothetical protein
MIDQHLKVYSDYSQFYLVDPARTEADWGDAWTPEAYADRAFTLPRMLGFGTGRYAEVPLHVRMFDAAPDVLAELFDHVVEADIETRSGKLTVAGCTEPWETAPTFNAGAGLYRVRFTCSGLETIEGDDGHDSYTLTLWRTAAPAPLTVLKRWVPPHER